MKHLKILPNALRTEIETGIRRCFLFKQPPQFDKNITFENILQDSASFFSSCLASFL